MKKEMKICFLFTIMIFFCNIAMNAQQKKTSERNYTEELRKINEKRAARYALISKMRQSAPVENPAPGPVNPNINQDPGTKINPAPSAPNYIPSNQKASQQPMRIPKKPVVLKE